jgi:hypothetical protein
LSQVRRAFRAKAQVGDLQANGNPSQRPIQDWLSLLHAALNSNPGFQRLADKEREMSIKAAGSLPAVAGYITFYRHFHTTFWTYSPQGQLGLQLLNEDVTP